jgi:4-hydroxy-2-oxoheptanedioate aldolase
MVRINKCIELIQQNQAIFAVSAPELTYECGKEMSQTWADLIQFDFEHHPFDTVGLSKFMKGLKDGGPTPSGHLTPTVITTVPSNCMTPEEVIYNAWQIRHVLSTGVHGILHTHTRRADAVATFVAASRYVFQTIGRDQGIPEGLRGGGGQKEPAAIWDMDPTDYMRKADPWPLNPNGELLLGLKIEDRFCLPDADNIAAVPGISFAEWGPGDMGMSHGDPDLHDPPYTLEMDEARNIVKNACDKSGLTFLCSWQDENLTIEERARHALHQIGARILHVPDEAIADKLRKEMDRQMPW